MQPHFHFSYICQTGDSNRRGTEIVAILGLRVLGDPVTELTSTVEPPAPGGPIDQQRARVARARFDSVSPRREVHLDRRRAAIHEIARLEWIALRVPEQPVTEVAVFVRAPTPDRSILTHGARERGPADGIRR